MTLRLIKGLVAGAAGTAAMTGHQKLRERLARRDAREEADGVTGEDSDQLDPWEAAPAPAQVGKRLLEGVFEWRVPPEAIPVLTHVMHWSYGTLWGGAFVVGRDSSRSRRLLLGPLFGLTVWGASYAQLVPLGIYEPPWRYPLGSLADELGYHITYGSTVALTYALVECLAA